jgi:hypothetical protein
MAYEVRVERERALDTVTLEEWFDLRRGQLPVVVTVMSKFVWDGEGYVEETEGRKFVLSFTFRQLEEAMPKLINGILSVLVPPKRSGGSV